MCVLRIRGGLPAARWKVEGEAFGTGPEATGRWPGEDAGGGGFLSGRVGIRNKGELIDGDPDLTEFKRAAERVRFIIGGRRLAGKDRECNLLIDGKPVRTRWVSNTVSGGSE